MQRFARSLTALLTATSVATSGCTGDGTGGSGPPRVTVRLTDAAGDVTAAVVTISEVYLQGSGGKVVLRSEPVTTNLLALANDVATLVDGAEVPAGSYSELRLVITGGYLAVANASGGTDIYASSPSYPGLPDGAQVTGDLQMPSLAQSGLKVQFDGAQDLTITADQDFLVDFDVAQSFGNLAGNSGKWVMHPVIKGASMSAAATVVATLRLGAGVTLPVVGGTPVTLAGFTAHLGSESQLFVDPDGDGVFEARFRFLLPGTYPVSLEAPLAVTFTVNPAIPAQVVATAGEQASVAFTLLSAAAPCGWGGGLGDRAGGGSEGASGKGRPDGPRRVPRPALAVA